MKVIDTINELSSTLLVNYKFRVIFEKFPIINIGFQKISGLASKVETDTFYQGGDNSTAYHLPNRVTYNNLVLERGIAIVSLKNIFDAHTMISELSFTPMSITVCSYLGNAKDIPMAAWILKSAYPVSWSISDLEADSNSVLIEKMELAYSSSVEARI